MKIHEYQGKEILKKYGVAIQDGIVASTVDEAVKAVNELEKQGIKQWVVKAQIHAGGRGKGKIYDKNDRKKMVLDGGVKFVTDKAKVKELCEKMLSNILVTHQTGEQGKAVNKVLIGEGLDIEKEFYVGITLDRETSQNAIMVSTEGGVEIEKVAAETPEKIVKEWVDPKAGFRGFQARKLAFALGFEGAAFKSAVKFFHSLYHVYEATDASLAEINPLVLTKQGEVRALDAKMNFDDNALYRHPEIKAMRDLTEEDPSEVEASAHNLNYIKLDGNVGCMVNGAGLAMATMDIIKLSGGEPANFLDVGGTASPETVENGFKIILSDPNVKALLINIFGGIVRCDRVANGIVQAARNININVPLVVRLRGTNAEEAKQILEASGIEITAAIELKEAAEKIKAVLAG